MKKLLLAFTLLLSSTGFSFQEKDINIHAGAGIFGSRGLVGVSAERFYTGNHALSVGFGADIIGMTSTLGYKYFGERMNTGNTVWDKCLFIFDCSAHPYIGGSLQYAGGTTATITSQSIQRRYEIDPKYFGLINVGVRDVYSNNITVDFEVSYRSIISGGRSRQVSGPSEDDRRFLEMGFRDLGVNVGIGYLF